MATKSVLMISKIHFGNNQCKDIKIGENKVYRVIVKGDIKYDSRDYNFGLSGSVSIPLGGTSNVKNLISSNVTSNYTGYNNSNVKVVGASADYAVSPTTISSNAKNTSRRTGTITVQQEDSGLSGQLN